MSLLTVGVGQEFTSISAAVNAARSGDTVNVQAGIYTNDFVEVDKNLTLNAVGGVVTMQATVQPPNGKAILTEGDVGLTVNINGFAFTGAAVRDHNGAGIRYEGGTLNITNSHFYGNENGILGAADPNGVITVDHSEFDHNGLNGSGYTHNLYIGSIASFTLKDSYVHDVDVGHEVKSRAENNAITNNRILDNNGNASYEIDLPNGGKAVIANNIIQQSVRSQNQNIIAYGEEGAYNSGSSLSVTGNTIINDMGRGPALWNAGAGIAKFTDNTVYGFGANPLVSGTADQSGTTVLTSRPTLDTSAVDLATTAVTLPITTTTPVVTTTPVSVPTPVVAPTPVGVSTTTPAPTGGLLLSLSEDAYQGDAQYTISVDGHQVGGIRIATALHGSNQHEQVALGPLTAGVHQIGVSFLNDKWDGSPSTDRNLYIDSATYDGRPVAGGSFPLMSNGTGTFVATGDTATTPAVPTPVAVTPTPTPVEAPTTTPAPTGGLLLSLSEDAYQGDAQYTISVDGHQVGGIRIATALHGSNQHEQVALGPLTAGVHQIGVSFLNDKWDGSPSTDRNLYIDSATYDGRPVAGGSFPLMSNGTGTFVATGDTATTPAVPTPVAVTPTPTPVEAPTTTPAPTSSGVTGTTETTASISAETTSNMVINVSGDAYQGNAKMWLRVDGQSIGVYDVSASHAAGQSQAVTISGIAETFSPHEITVSFINDLYGGSPNADRNLYLNSIRFDNKDVAGGSAVFLRNDSHSYTATAPVSWTGH